jgi:hypothetical protein
MMLAVGLLGVVALARPAAAQGGTTDPCTRGRCEQLPGDPGGGGARCGKEKEDLAVATVALAAAATTGNIPAIIAAGFAEAVAYDRWQWCMTTLPPGWPWGYLP